MNENKYDLNVNLISPNLEDGEKFKNSFKRKLGNITVKTIFDYWNFIDNLGQTFDKQVNIIFKKFLDLKKDTKKECLTNECLVVISNESQAQIILEKMNNDLKNRDFMPLTLFLYKEQKFKINVEEKYPKIDPRTIIIENFSNLNLIPNGNEFTPIQMILIRFCSIYNELGEKFSIGKGNELQNYSLTKNAFPFYLNIICLGRFRQGKSTTVNCILNELKTRETGAGTSQTKKITFYEVENEPIRIYDLPGFQDRDSIIEVVEKMKELNKGISDLKDKFHIILYIFNNNNTEIFQDKEFLIFQELINHNDAKIIYLFTHSNTIDQEEINEKIEKIDRAKNAIIEKGIETLKKEKENIKDIDLQNLQKLKTAIEEKMAITEENLIFVNFVKERNNPKRGINDLFKKINQLFQSTTSYKKRNEDRIKKGDELKIRAKKELNNNLVGGTILGVFPIIDIFCQETLIKPYAIEKASKIFGLDYSQIIKEENDLIEKIGHNTVIGVGEGYGGKLISVGLEKVGKTVTHTVIKNVDKTFYGYKYGTEAIETIVPTTQKVTNSLFKAGTGVATMGLSLIIGAGLGYYFTSKHLDSIVDKLYEYYIRESSDIGRSYEQAADYLHSMEAKYQLLLHTSI